MSKIFEIKSGAATKEFTLDYDRLKDKYYLNICAYGEMWTETFLVITHLKSIYGICGNFQMSK